MRDSDEECLISGNVERHNGAHCSKYPLGIPSYDYHRKVIPSEDLLDEGYDPHLDSKQFRCAEPGCGRSFSSKFKLMRHALIHSGERQFKCNICGRCFHRKDHLKNHLQVHNPNKTQHSCDKCSKQYTSSLSFKKHLALHAAEAGDLVCKLCGKMCSSKEQIMHHLKIHSGSRALKGPNERKFNCDQCDRAFFTRKDVKRHLVVHTGVRNFICELCPQRFGRKDHLVRHLKKSHANSSHLSNGDGNGSGSDIQVPIPDLVKNNGQSMHHPHLGPPQGGMVPQQPCSSLASLHHEQMISIKHEHGESAPQMVAIKQENCYPQDSAAAPIVTSAAGPTLMNGETHEAYLRLPDIIPSIQPTTSYPITTFSPSLPHIIQGNCYLSPMSGALTLEGGATILPTGPHGYLDMTNPALPHFSQAFQ